MVSIRMVLNVTEYHADVYYNSHTGERAHAAFPDGVIDDVNYDGSIRAFLFLLNNDCCTSIDKSRAFLSDLTGGKLNISKGMISRTKPEFALKLSLNAGLPMQICCFPLLCIQIVQMPGKTERAARYMSVQHRTEKPCTLPARTCTTICCSCMISGYLPRIMKPKGF